GVDGFDINETTGRDGGDGGDGGYG
ncbi:hypothetical protein, partial [Mycobacterium tuberculosis]